MTFDTKTFYNTMVAPVAPKAVVLVYYSFRQFIYQAQLYSQLQLGLHGDPITLCVPTST